MIDDHRHIYKNIYVCMHDVGSERCLKKAKGTEIVKNGGWLISR